MRQSRVHLLRSLVVLFALSLGARAYADDRAEARVHYQTGVKFYGAGDYRGAIREFSAAQQLAPADLNNYNLALCYDKLGDAEPAVQYYRAFLDKQPNSDKRAEIEASISRLEAASRSAAGKKADEARKADDARRADDARQGPIGPQAGPSAGPPPGPAIGPAQGPIGPSPAPDAEERKPRKGPAVAGSIGTPGTASPVPTGDQQLDRVNSINIDDVRDQRMGGAGSGLTDTRGGPATGPAQPGQLGQPGQPAPPGGPGAPTSEPALSGTDQPKKEGPVYKKWWFWVVMAVSAGVVYELATSSSEKSTRGRQFSRTNSDPLPGGMTLLRW
jgi:iron complex outermembrane receptor protein